MNLHPLHTAFFYQQPVLLEWEKHKSLRFRAGDFHFAKEITSVPILINEFLQASVEYPIVFNKDGDGRWMALAITGLKAHTNVFVDAKGVWRAHLIPASVRRYPFILAETAPDQFKLAIDRAAPHIGDEGTPLFDDPGQPSAHVQALIPSLREFQNQVRSTSSFIQSLEDLGILARQTLQITLGDRRTAAIEGCWTIQEDLLQSIRNEAVLRLFKGGNLALIHALMLSLRNLALLLERSKPKRSIKKHK